jgi:hypothetical protein
MKVLNERDQATRGVGSLVKAAEAQLKKAGDSARKTVLAAEKNLEAIRRKTAK